MIPQLTSVKAIEQQYRTGEEPVLVVCSDRNAYICKYMRTSASAFKLACELIGAQMGMAWQLNTPPIAFVKIKPAHWGIHRSSRNLSAPTLGSRRIHGVVDVTSSTYGEIPQSASLFRQLLKIALFDFWIANEDRNANNANLLYDVINRRLVSIDYGCIMNTATFEYPLSQLTSTDTILNSDLFLHLARYRKRIPTASILTDLKPDYEKCLLRSAGQTAAILESIPKEWNLPLTLVEEKLRQFLDAEWQKEVWSNFVECLNENMPYE